METTSHSHRRTLSVPNSRCLNTRTTAAFVKMAMQFKSNIIVKTQNTTCNGKSLMSLLYAGAQLGETLTILALGPDATQAVDALEQLLQKRFPTNSIPETNSIVAA